MENQRDRLIELIQNAVNGCARHWAEIIADHLLANGVIVPPCKVGDTVYRISQKFHTKVKYIEKTTVSRIAIDKNGIFIFCTCNPIVGCVFGKTVFASCDEAEKILKI